MYPYLRLAAELLRHRSAPRLAVGEEHRSTHICWPWDVDPWRELNNGRTLTLYDPGRIVLVQRLGIARAMRAWGWGGTIAGVSVRYRRRVRAFDRYELRSRVIGWDDRFYYAEQGIWRRGECCSHGLLRMAITSPAGIVPPREVGLAVGAPTQSPPLPGWVRAWIDAEAERPWPPMVAEAREPQVAPAIAEAAARG